MIVSSDRVTSERGLLTIALATSAVAVAVAGALRLLEGSSGGGGLGDRLFAVLVAAGFADAAVLSRRRSAAVAWSAALIATAIAAFEIARVLRDLGLVTDDGSTAVGLVSTIVAFVTASAVALLSVARTRDRGRSGLDRIAVGVVALASVAVAGAGAWTLVDGLLPRAAAAAIDSETAPARITGRLALAAVGLALALGVMQDLQPGVARGWRRWRAATSASTGEASRSLLGYMADELVPWGAAAQSRAREDERARLAADLHALVLPDLRKAAAAAASGRPGPESVGVQRALEDVEQLMHGRQSIVLEEFGLVAALEWLAERTEERSDLQVDLRLEGELVDQRDAVRADIARAAFRIALLAIDNVDRHAQAASATLGLRVERGLVALEVADDGPSGQDWKGEGGRGLADMRSEAAATGGTFRIDTRPTRVEVSWRTS